MKGHWAGTVCKLCIQWSVKGLFIFIKMYPKWPIWASPISLSGISRVAANSMFAPPPGTASFLLAPTVCVQLSCSSFFITPLGLGPRSSTNNPPDCCRPQEPCLYSLQALGQPWFKGFSLACWLLPWTLCLAPMLEVPDESQSSGTWTRCADLCLSYHWSPPGRVWARSHPGLWAGAAWALFFKCSGLGEKREWVGRC